ncbi:MAG: UDP-3-O-(3-hydroxymyristoyl)glucosamine N-acyltransferase [Azospirillaceae bacterium]
MADPRFFSNAGPFTLGRLAEIGEAELAEGADPERRISDVAPLETAGPQELSFLENRKYAAAFEVSAAGACVVAPAFVKRAPEGMALLVSPKPYRSYALMAQAFYPAPSATAGVHPSAVVDPSATVAPSAEIGPYAVIGPRAEIGERCRIGAHAIIGHGVVLGADTAVLEGASVAYALVGERVVIYPGARVGQDGFGFAMDPAGHVRVPQVGRVLVGDDVEIGANVTIDRGAGPDTVIGRGSMIDNLVQIGHNVQIGEGSVIVAQAGIAGSSKLGRFVALGAQSGVAGHLELGDGARLAAASGLMDDIEPGQEYCGLPAIPCRQFWRLQVRLARMMDKKDG